MLHKWNAMRLGIVLSIFRQKRIEMGHCKDCKWWRSDDKECRAIGEESNQYYEPLGNDFVLYVRVTDDHGLETALKTGPMFGCVQFLER